MSPSTTPPQKTIGWIGVGVMGAAMAGRLMDAGYALVVHNRTRARAEGLITRGARWEDTPAAVAAAAPTVITMVGYPADVEAVYFGSEGLLKNTRPGALFIDMTTSKPSLAARIADAAREKGADALDAPVSGGDIGARNGALSIMVGGSHGAFKTALPLFEILGKTIILQGEAGAGQHTKMCNQIAIAGTMLGLCEALAYAGRAGLDAQRALDSVSGGAAGSWAMEHLAPRILGGDFDPGFYVKHFRKDIAIAREEAEAMGLDARALALADGQYARLAAQAGGGERGTQALFQLYAKAFEKGPPEQP